MEEVLTSRYLLPTFLQSLLPSALPKLSQQNKYLERKLKGFAPFA